MTQIAVFASGSGTNAENLIRSWAGHKHLKIAVVMTNNPDAGVIGRAGKLGVPCMTFTRKQFLEGDDVLKLLNEKKIDAIILAGFLLLIPKNIIHAFPEKVINVHPALLPAHGGKGFYGANVHQAVINSGSVISGITIHKVNDRFDEGEIIFQAACHVAKNDTAETLAEKIHQLEYKYFPVVAEKYFRSLNTV